MLDEIKRERFAEVLWWALTQARRKPLARGESILIRFDPQALDLAEALFRLVLDRGLDPVVRQNLSSRMRSDLLAKESRKRLDFLQPGEVELYQEVAGEISIEAPDLTCRPQGHPDQLARLRRSRGVVERLIRQREAQGDFGRTTCVYPTPALARRAGLDEEEHSRLFGRACLLDSSMPVNEWKLLKARMESITAWLDSLGAREYRVESEDIDLTVRPGKSRRWVTALGRNMPSFELYLTPNWRGTEGRFASDVPSWRDGRCVEGASLTFSRGQVVDYQARSASFFLVSQLKLDRGSGRLGEFSLTDKRLSPIDRCLGHGLLDENLGGRFGNCHLGLGASLDDSVAAPPGLLSDSMREVLGLNDSQLHWDLVNASDKRVTAVLGGGSRRTVYESGQFRC